MKKIQVGDLVEWLHKTPVWYGKGNIIARGIVVDIRRSGVGAKTGLYAVTGQDKHGVFNGQRIRRLTPLECERLQGFDDNWTAGESDSQRYKMLGNAVSVPIVQMVFDRLLKEGQANG